MNAEKLKKIQNEVRIGGKGTPRRKKKIIHVTATTDDKKLQSALKKLSVTTIPGIEEVNIIKDDLTVIHFNNPKTQASLSANTFAITGHGETRKVVEMLPEILPQLGQQSIGQLRDFATTMAASQLNYNNTEDEDVVPKLVEDFEQVAMKNEIFKKKNGKAVGDEDKKVMDKKGKKDESKGNAQKDKQNKNLKNEKQQYAQKNEEKSAKIVEAKLNDLNNKGNQQKKEVMNKMEEKEVIKSMTEEVQQPIDMKTTDEMIGKDVPIILSKEDFPALSKDEVAMLAAPVWGPKIETNTSGPQTSAETTVPTVPKGIVDIVKPLEANVQIAEKPNEKIVKEICQHSEAVEKKTDALKDKGNNKQQMAAKSEPPTEKKTDENQSKVEEKKQNNSVTPGTPPSSPVVIEQIKEDNQKMKDDIKKVANDGDQKKMDKKPLEKKNDMQEVPPAKGKQAKGNEMMNKADGKAQVEKHEPKIMQQQKSDNDIKKDLLKEMVEKSVVEVPVVEMPVGDVVKPQQNDELLKKNEEKIIVADKPIIAEGCVKMEAENTKEAKDMDKKIKEKPKVTAPGAAGNASPPKQMDKKPNAVQGNKQAMAVNPSAATGKQESPRKADISKPKQQTSPSKTQQAQKSPPTMKQSPRGPANQTTASASGQPAEKPISPSKQGNSQVQKTTSPPKAPPQTASKVPKSSEKPKPPTQHAQGGNQAKPKEAAKGKVQAAAAGASSAKVAPPANAAPNK